METTTPECMDDYGDGTCRGSVEYRAVPGGSAMPRCDAHFARRLDRWENSIEREAMSPLAPSWFDPSYAGERWDDDY